MRFAVFASGSGSNFQALIESLENEPQAEFTFVFSDKPDSRVLERAGKLGIKAITKQPKDFEDRQAYEKFLVEICREADVDYILLAGYMRLIHSPLLQAYPKRIINIHPSLLPHFPGKQGIEDAFKAGTKQTGVTIHYVDDKIDHGEIIMQESIKIEETDTLETLSEKIHALEHALYPQVVRQLIKGAE